MSKKITEIKPQVRNKSRFSVFIDGEFSFGISEFDLLKLSLKQGQELTDGELIDIIKSVDESECQEYANSLVNQKLYTEKKLREKLYSKQFSSISINSVVDKLKGYGYIDDFLYAETYIEELKNKYGVMKLKQKLYERGISREIIDKCLEDFENQGTALAVLKIKTRGQKPLKDDYPKLLRFLAQKGFQYDQAKNALNTFLEEFDVE